VKPWFTGKLDFAPRVEFAGDDEFPLAGGALGRFRDRPAAVFVWKRRLHTISLLVFRADGLSLGKRTAAESRGFNVLTWRDGDLGYALVSDVSRADLELLAGKLSRE
jgi:anti-sigma factor RsiW